VGSQIPGFPMKWWRDKAVNCNMHTSRYWWTTKFEFWASVGQ